MINITRRSALGLVGGVAAATAFSTRVAFAAGSGPRRFVLVIQRGGMDGVAGVAPYGDPAYVSARNGLAMPKPGESGGVLDLDGTFGFHPALKALMPLWKSKELAVIHAAGLLGYDGRSHFDAQDLLETAGAKPHARGDGWLNRVLPGLANLRDVDALAVSQTVPLVLQGKHKVASWAPSMMPAPDDDYLRRVAMLYQGDPALASAFKTARDVQGIAGSSARSSRPGPADFATYTKGAAAIMKDENGPRIAVFDFDGWDTHSDQERTPGGLPDLLGQLGDGLVAFKTALGPLWRDTAVVVVTEFGRTVAQNGSRGTDHGTGGVAFVLGGTVEGGKVYGDWPGLAKASLNDQRDLKITTDVTSIFKAALADHMHFPRRAIAAGFGTAGAPVKGLFRA